MKKSKILSLVFGLAVFLFLANPVSAGDDLNVYFFWGDGCPHCAKEESCLAALKKEYPSINIHDFEIYTHPDNVLLLQKVSEELGMRVDGVPFLIIGDKHFVGFSERSTPDELKNRIEFCLSHQCPDRVAEIVGVKKLPSPDQENSGQNKKPPVNNDSVAVKEINLPLFGKINPASFSLPALTIIIGALDGFNPCAMWTLLFLISLLLGLQSRKRMWILGMSFIAASALVYFLFMVAWLHLILFLGMVIGVRIAIGLVALLGGAYNLKEFFTEKDSGCKIAGDGKRQKTFDRIKAIVQLNSFWLALGGITILAFAVNLVELICSAGLPAVYTQILVLSNLAKWQYYLYIVFYIFIFMLDDLLVFLIAMITLQMTGVTTKYARASKLIGGLLMLIIGILLIFKPQLLMFGY